MVETDLTNYERGANRAGFLRVAGIDEAGRGPLAGPVVAAAVIFPVGYNHPCITDSKKISAPKREALYEEILAEATAVGLGIVEADVIDRINILQATLIAMRDAIAHLEVTPDYLLIDGVHRIPSPVPQWPIVKGDASSISIAAASIVAKVTRDRIMEIYDRRYPAYHFAQNKGYGTAAHREAIRSHGPCTIHRRSFHLSGERRHP